MSINTQNSKIIFGLKVKQFRLANELSSSDLSKASGLSLSYLNEIEKGKKKPRKEKIINLAEALGTTPEELSSSELSGNLSAIGELLHSNFLNELPLELFDIDLSKIVEIVAVSPSRVGAFISTLIEISRNYAFKEENFYFQALRAYQELNYNYFEEKEKAIAAFIKQFNIPISRPVPVKLLVRILENHFSYTIIESSFEEMPVLKTMRSVYVPNSKKLYINKELNAQQKALQLGKEIAYNYLKLEDRINTSSFLKVKNFQTVLNNYFAGYFAVGILVNKDNFINDLRHLFSQTTWQEDLLLDLLDKYEVSPEVLFQRFNLLPAILNIKKLFFLRMLNEEQGVSFRIDKEMHLNRRHQPHANNLAEHYCRRWLSITQLKALQSRAETEQQPVVGIQRSIYTGTDREYLCLTIARPSYFPHTKKVSVTIGLLVDEDLKKHVHFLNDPAIPKKMVSVTCERCAIEDCSERAVPPIVIQKKQQRKAIQDALDQLK